ncbi:hypothetical protein AMS68_004979 [Peltaster fructicola]|uniref:Dynactin subunit 6 n=1 Tax=Peltaster fructicola TaxID=286661 RepID=A0A6H0XXG2_9PEZI|nr:hypothetical protein AMS68_004979 [Peltaster fructicola]
MSVSSQQRQSTTVLSTQTVKPPCKIHATATISDRAIITGTHQVEIGENSVLHPYAKIRAEGGRVIIGAYCTIAEAAVVGTSEEHEGDVVINDYVVIDSGAQVEAASVGYSSEVGIQAVVGHEAIIGKYCKIAPKWCLKPGQTLEDYTVIYGDNLVRKDASAASNASYRDARLTGQERHVEVLRRKIPNGAVKFSNP